MMEPDKAITLGEFMDAIRPWIERQVDDAILAQPEAENRRFLMHQRERIVDKLMDLNRIRNLKYRLAEAEARLRPRLVSD